MGVAAVLAMQANVRDGSAIVLAGELIRQLASGWTLEKAASLARVKLLELETPRLELYHPLDWASPVVWSGAPSDGRLTWSCRLEGPAQFQLAGRALLRERADSARRPLDDAAGPTPAEVARGTRWLERHGPGSPARRLRARSSYSGFAPWPAHSSGRVGR